MDDLVGFTTTPLFGSTPIWPQELVAFSPKLRATKYRKKKNWSPQFYAPRFFVTSWSWSCTPLLSPPASNVPQVTTDPLVFSAAKAKELAWICSTFFNSSCTSLLSPPSEVRCEVEVESHGESRSGKVMESEMGSLFWGWLLIFLWNLQGVFSWRFRSGWMLQSLMPYKDLILHGIFLNVLHVYAVYSLYANTFAQSRLQQEWSNDENVHIYGIMVTIMHHNCTCPEAKGDIKWVQCLSPSLLNIPGFPSENDNETPDQLWLYPTISNHIHPYNQIDSCRFKTAWTKPPSRSLHRPMSRPSHRSGWRQRPGRSLGRASRPSTDPGPQWNLHRHEGCPNKLRLHRHGWQQMRFRSLGSAERQRVDLALHCYHHLFKHQPAGAGE